MAKLLGSCLSLFDTIIESHAMDQNDLFRWKVEEDFMCNKSYLIHDINFVYVVETFITLNYRA